MNHETLEILAYQRDRKNITMDAMLIAEDESDSAEFIERARQSFEIEKYIYDAVKAQAEHENGCEKCNDPDMEYGAVSFPRTSDGDISIKDMKATEANFCPNCGRKLK